MSVVIFDIDGVFVPFYARYNPRIGFSWQENGRKGDFLKPEMQRPWIEELSAIANLVWGSAREDANCTLELLQIDQEWERIELEYRDLETTPITWKLESIQAWVADNVPDDELLVWVDDELQQDAFDWAAERGNMLAIAPLKDEGLTQPQYETIIAFLKG